MKNKVFILFIAAVVTGFFWIAQSSALEADYQKKLVEDNSAFAIELFQKLCDSDKNVFFSPSSLSTAMAIVYAGSRGNTARQIERTMHYSLGQEKVHSAFGELRRHLEDVKRGGNVKLGDTNSLWIQKDYELNRDFQDSVGEFYDASIMPVDFVKNAAAERVKINGWASDKTNGKITNVLPEGSLSNLTRILLINAIYFKGDWANKFNIKETEDSPFFASPHLEVQVPTMHQTGSFNYAETDAIRILEMPYTGGNLSMMILLPKRYDGINHLVKNLDQENFSLWREHLVQREVRVYLPRFKVDSGFDMKGILAAMGIREAFGSRANFSGIFGIRNDLYISTILHRAMVEVNEEGSEAAAVTAIKLKPVGMVKPPRQPVFRVDRPYVFLIQDNLTGSILFMGRVMNPAGT